MISIVLLTWNQDAMTDQCIRSIVENTGGYELIVVDNGSEEPYRPPADLWVDVTAFGDGAGKYLSARDEGVGPLVLLRNEENAGYPAAANQGIRAAGGDVIVVLNNDVIVTPEWADRMLDHLLSFSIVAPMTNYAMGMQRVTIPCYSGEEELYEKAREWSAKHNGKSIEANWVIPFCGMFRRALVDEIGFFDESMWPCSGEDIDFCLEARKRGHRVGIAKDVYIHHEGSQTFEWMEREGIMSYSEVVEKTHKKLMGKWGASVLSDQAVRSNGTGGLRINLGCGRFKLPGFVNVDREEGVVPDLVADVLTLPYEPGSVDEIYAGHLLEHLDWEEGGKALAYWFSLLKPGGRISICIPDVDILFRQYVADPTPEKLQELNDLYIYSYRQKSPHRYAYSGALLKGAMEAAGFTGIEKMPVNHDYFVEPVAWQTGFSGVKP